LVSAQAPAVALGYVQIARNQRFKLERRDDEAIDVGETVLHGQMPTRSVRPVFSTTHGSAASAPLSDALPQSKLAAATTHVTCTAARRTNLSLFTKAP
jgi:hypothetical protein